jgi:hypothetical protein
LLKPHLRQPSNDSAIATQKFYFPSSNYADSIALIKAMPKLAEEVLSVYHEQNKRTFFENSVYYNFAGRELQ